MLLSPLILFSSASHLHSPAISSSSSCAGPWAKGGERLGAGGAPEHPADAAVQVVSLDIVGEGWGTVAA